MKGKADTPLMPPLSPLDNGLYLLLISLFLFAGLFGNTVALWLLTRAAVKDPAFLALGLPEFPLAYYIFVALSLGTAFLALHLRNCHQPLLGNPDIRYGTEQWAQVYPIVSRKFWSGLWARKKALCIAMAGGILALFIVIFGILPELPAWHYLYEDGSIAVCGGYYQKTASYPAGQLDRMDIYTSAYRTSRPNNPYYWCVEARITAKDGTQFVFTPEDFPAREKNISGFITGMHRLKDSFPGTVTVTDSMDALAYVIRDMDLNEQEAALLRSLFDPEDG